MQVRGREAHTYSFTHLLARSAQGSQGPTPVACDERVFPAVCPHDEENQSRVGCLKGIVQPGDRGVAVHPQMLRTITVSQ